MGAGDWNDGMDRVGIGGRGESIWLGWFLYAALTEFAPLCEAMGDAGLAEMYRSRAEQLRLALEEHGWDGEWYRRAYYDDGWPLGSAANRECRIDAIAQSWAVLSGAGQLDRVKQAMESVHQHLVRPQDGLVLLFTPPFDKTPRDPGYIKGYPPGIRENGGQYTHAALWTVWAYAKLGQSDRAEALFRLINPIYHSDTTAKAAHYGVEPYVVVADVYGAPPYTGRGGWSWYTGSAGWMYRLGIEAILGLRRLGRFLAFDPRIPTTWPGFTVLYREGRSCYRIRVENPYGVSHGVAEVQVDGRPVRDGLIPLIDDGQEHTACVRLGNDRN
jgi:cyclic beta-1,2-glucan synthetase